MSDCSIHMNWSIFKQVKVELQTYLHIFTRPWEISNLHKLSSFTANKTPFIDFIVWGDSNRPWSPGSDVGDPLSIHMEPWDNFGDKDRFLTRHTITLPMNVESKSIQVAAPIARLAFTRWINRIHAIAPTSYHKSMEISHGNIRDFPIIKLLQLKYLLSCVLRVICADPHAPIEIGARRLKLIGAITASCRLQLDLDQDLELLKLAHQTILPYLFLHIKL